ncbi:MAG TPA: hypothetical protein VKE25_03995 [Actinomycetes bacterium]|nr:hypothetical protein [Actinomycetes bacterium]
MSPVLTIDRRFNGPPDSANGGYLSGRLAALLSGGLPGADPVAVTLRKPPPLAEPMTVIDGESGLRLSRADTLIAEAAPADLTSATVEPASADEATAAARYYGGLVEHPFPTCFVCGLARPARDGLRLQPGLLPDRADTTAALWRPDASLADRDRVRPEFVWAALDCPGGWTVDLVGRPMVLGRMTAQVRAVPDVGEPCVVVGRLNGRDGRKAFTTTTGYGADDRILGQADAIWIAIT